MKRENDHEIEIKGQNLILTPEKALFWVEEQMLVVADVHLGKSGHFQKAGIPLPSSGNAEDLLRLKFLIEAFNPKSVLFLGDLFHSKKNEEWEQFRMFRKEFQELEMILVLGNHEILGEVEYQQLGLKTISELSIDPFLFVHDETDHKSKFFSISGHIHPSISIRGKGRQRIRIPCFFFSERSIILPAFGKFTGTHGVKSVTNDSIFGVLEGQIIQF